MPTELPDHELTRERAERIRELAAAHGPDWATQFKPGTLGGHELLDRAWIVGDIVENLLLSHPACVANPDWFALSYRATSILRELYQQIGAAHNVSTDDGGTRR